MPIGRGEVRCCAPPTVDEICYEYRSRTSCWQSCGAFRVTSGAMTAFRKPVISPPVFLVGRSGAYVSAESTGLLTGSRSPVPASRAPSRAREDSEPLLAAGELARVLGLDARLCRAAELATRPPCALYLVLIIPSILSALAFSFA
jgi:hypothetical protein